ncbi:unnamed protein product [Arctia plantaginis]|uniref:Cadherin-like protein n=1 Tax=Arctia plantaginis TaxID=874455 RepID=A0A8S0YSM7_ARCPL|nr:unnamed protein product [Arctia plantaginis]
MGILFFFILLISLGLSTSNQCSIGGASADFINIFDTSRGVIFSRTTNNLQGIASYAFSQQLNYGPYFSLTLVDSHFTIETTDAFEYYEENETLLSVAITATFSCLNGPSEFLMLIITITDTNNNAPQFLPSDEFTYTVPTPFPAGLAITGCFDGITVRDIDLTTQRIDFEIEENPYFEIVYDEKSSTTKREFVGILRSTTFIRTLLEPITLKITATDVDLTGDPPLTAVATVTFKGETTFTLPEDPVFSHPFYFANYTMDHQVILLEPISLQSGFHKLVNFTLHGDFSDNFELVVTGDQVTIQNRIPLETYILRETQIILVIRADREETTGDRATIILQLPEGISLQFEQSNYRGTIKNNILQIAVLSLLQGYEGEVVNTEVLGEHSQFFTTIE